jgi:hypothetical protein
MRKGLNEVISSISEVKDEYEQVGSDDMASKIMIAN